MGTSKLLDTIVLWMWCTEGFRGALSWAPNAEREASISRTAVRRVIAAVFPDPTVSEPLSIQYQEFLFNRDLLFVRDGICFWTVSFVGEQVSYIRMYIYIYYISYYCSHFEHFSVYCEIKLNPKCGPKTNESLNESSRRSTLQNDFFLWVCCSFDVVTSN